MIRSAAAVACLGILVSILGCAGGPSEPPVPPASTDTRITVANVGFATPESVLYDDEADVYLVSNINGNPTGADGNGFISRVAPDGQVLELKWIDGSVDGVELDAPKGLALSGNVLYVADITRVRQFDRSTGRSLGTLEIPGTTFVNDVAAAADGSLYVSDSGIAFSAGGTVDTGSAAIYRILGNGTVEMLAEGSGLQRPNGLVETPDRGLVMVPFGSSAVFGVAADGGLTAIVTLPAGALDGVVETGDGTLLVSSWESGSVYAVSPGTDISLIAGDLPSPADIGYDSKRRRVLVPLFNSDSIVLVPLPAAAAE